MSPHEVLDAFWEDKHGAWRTAFIKGWNDASHPIDDTVPSLQDGYAQGVHSYHMRHPPTEPTSEEQKT